VLFSPRHGIRYEGKLQRLTSYIQGERHREKPSADEQIFEGLGEAFAWVKTAPGQLRPDPAQFNIAEFEVREVRRVPESSRIREPFSLAPIR
jgi:hypothetical protein